MTCAKCNHGFCWRCLKSWKPNHKDYYNCSAMVRGRRRKEGQRPKGSEDEMLLQGLGTDISVSQAAEQLLGRRLSGEKTEATWAYGC